MAKRLYLTNTAPSSPGSGSRAYFDLADWHWNPIPASPVLDANSANIVSGGGTGKGLAQNGHIVNCVKFGNTLRGPDGLAGATRYTVAAQYAGPPDNWGPAFPSGATIPIPAGTQNFLAPGDGDRDAHVAIADPVDNKVYSMWIAEYNSGSNTWSCGWGGTADLHGDGRETIGGSTGSGLSRYACVIRVAELEAGVIPHALFFSTDIVQGPNGGSNFVYPATKTDGQNMANATHTIKEGQRVQLDPTLNPDSYGLNQAERAIFVALQTYGAYCGDNGGTRMAFLSELATDWTGGANNPGARYAATGINVDYYSLSKIPWSSLRVLKNWNGAA